MIRAICSVVLASVVVTACAGSHAETPAWFDQRKEELDAQGAPSLRGIPEGTDAVTDPAHWAAVEADISAAEAALKADPRSAATPADAQSAEAAEAEARAALAHSASQY